MRGAIENIDLIEVSNDLDALEKVSFIVNPLSVLS